MLPQLAAKVKGAALNLLFPQRCLGCGEEGSLLCHACQKHMPRVVAPICPKCGRPQSSGILCSSCVAWHNSIDGIRSPLKFEGLIREAVHQFKYKNLRSLSGPLGTILRDYLVQNPLPALVLVPVPLHSRRLRERGYNQSFLLVKELSYLLRLPVASDSLTRTKYLVPQAKTASVEERRQNVSQAFSCNSGFKGARALLIDDVATSGATLDACALALKSAGALSVWGLVVAREL